ncbi:MAG: zinc-binding dehydrogenase [Conexivisphaerales archaeon]
MKAVRLIEKGKLETSEVPLPDKLEADQVLIKIDVTGICYRDILTVDGFFPNTKYPITLGHEITGRIIEKGENVRSFSVGDRIASLIYEPCGKCVDCLNGRENICRYKKTFGEELDGSYSEYIVARERSLVKVPAGASAEAAAISACVTGMLLHAFNRADTRPGETVLVTGAGGGVGIHAVQIAKALGCRVIAATSSMWKAEKIREYGADEVIIHQGNFNQQVKELTSGRGVDVVLESVGTPTLSDSIRSLSWGGRMVVVGNVNPAPTQLMLGHIILRENSIIGSLSSTRKEVEQALRLSAEGKIRPVVHAVLPLDQASEGHKIMKERGSLGRILLKP